MKAGKLSPAARWRWQVAARLLAAVPGGYGLAALSSSVAALLAQAAGMAPADAVISASLLSFAVYLGVVVWSFGAATLARLWGSLLACTLLLALLRQSIA